MALQAQVRSCLMPLPKTAPRKTSELAPVPVVRKSPVDGPDAAAALPPSPAILLLSP